MRKIASSSLAAVALSAAALLPLRCEAQTLPWPTDPPASGGATAPWPANPPRAGAPAPAAAAAPAPMMAAPMGAGPMTPVPPQDPGGGNTPPCMDEFTKLQGETDKRAKAAKAASARKAQREEMCKILQSFEGAIGKWAKYVKDNASSCGIPEKIIEQLKTGHDNISKSAKQVCDGGGLGGAPAKAPAPTLSDALGTTRTPMADTSRPSAATGTLNTLTGTPLGR
jgi:hypothetical protein